MLLPNQTEAEFLTGVKIRTLGDAARACQALHDLGPKVVVITSIELASAPGTIEVSAILACLESGVVVDMFASDFCLSSMLDSGNTQWPEYRKRIQARVTCSPHCA